MKIQKKQEIEFFGTKTGNANSIALGYATETKNFGEVAVGVMNKSTAAKDPNSSKGVCVDPDATLFSVGCGGSGERKNALEVKGDGSVIISNGDTNMNVANKIKEALAIENNIELVKSTDNDLQYTLMVNNTAKGEINIPKDQFLKNVVYDDTEKQLVFTFVTLDEDEHVEKVPVGDLKDIYTAGDNITIENNKISADLSTVMTAISDEKTQRETTDNEIKSTLDSKADLMAVQQMLLSKVDLNISDGTINICGIQGVGFSPSDTIVFNTNKGVVDLSDYAKATDLNTNIKALQDALEEKADDVHLILLNDALEGKADKTSIPTKTSQLTNDSNFITTYTETDPVWTSEKGNYYTKTEIDNKGYLTQHQSLTDYAKKTDIPNTSNFVEMATDESDTNLYNGKNGTATLSITYGLAIAGAAGGISLNPSVLNISNSEGFTFNVNPSSGIQFSVKGVGVHIGANGSYTLTNPSGSGVNPAHTQYIVPVVDGTFYDLTNKADIVDGKLKSSQLPQLDNITAATTADEVVTKFNALLTDLKAKGFMAPDAEK